MDFVLVELSQIVHAVGEEDMNPIIVLQEKKLYADHAMATKQRSVTTAVGQEEQNVTPAMVKELFGNCHLATENTNKTKVVLKKIVSKFYQ